MPLHNPKQKQFACFLRWEGVHELHHVLSSFKDQDYNVANLEIAERFLSHAPPRLLNLRIHPTISEKHWRLAL